jgi:transposase
MPNELGRSPLGRLCMSNNAAERKVRAVAVRRKNCTFAG